MNSCHQNIYIPSRERNFRNKKEKMVKKSKQKEATLKQDLELPAEEEFEEDVFDGLDSTKD